MENTLLENSKGATYMSFLLDVEIIIKKGGVRADLAESKMKNTTQGTKTEDKDAKSNKQPNESKTKQDKQGGVNVYAAEMDQSDIFQRLAGESEYEQVSSLKKESKTGTNLDNVSDIYKGYTTDVVSKKDSTVRKKRKTDRTAKAFKGKVEPIDFWECNRIFLCNRLHVGNQKMPTKIFYSKKSNVRRFSKTISNIKVLNSQNNDRSHLLSKNSLNTLNKMNQISLPNLHEQFKTKRRFASLENTSGVGYRRNKNSDSTPPLKPPIIFIESYLERSVTSQIESASCDQFHPYQMRNFKTSYNKFNEATKIHYINTGSARKRPKYFTRFTMKTKTLTQIHDKYTDEKKKRQIPTKYVKSWPVVCEQDCNAPRRSGSCPLIRISSTSCLLNDKTKAKVDQDPRYKNNSIENAVSIEHDLVETYNDMTSDEMKTPNGDYQKQNKKNWRHIYKNMFSCITPKD